MKKVYFRTIQKSNKDYMTINIPKDISHKLGLSIGDVVIYDLTNGIVELKKANLNLVKDVKI